MGKAKKLKRKIKELEKAHAKEQAKKKQYKKALKALKQQLAEVKQQLAEVKQAPAESKALAEKQKKTFAKPARPRKHRSSKSSKEELFRRIKANAKNIDFNRIGKATAKEKDDLQRIKGIGPFLEKKLNTLGIFTLQQIANFTTGDENKVTEAIEFFKGRMKREKWVAQSKKLMKES